MGVSFPKEIGGISMIHSYIAVLKPFGDEQGYTVYFPDFKGAISEGSTFEESVRNAREVLEIYLDMDVDNLPVPSTAKELARELEGDGDLLQVVTVDMDLVKRREMNKAVNKMVTLPKWLLDLGKERKVNFSQLLQQALREELNV